MNPTRRFSGKIALAVATGVALLALGCGNPFVVKHKVLVDAISAPGVAKPTGMSYRLLAKKSTVNQVQAQVNVIKACVDAALAGMGMFEPPPTVAPDLFIEVNYGVDTSARVDPSSRETFLQLSARANPDGAIERGTGPEVWDVRVAVLGVAGRLESAMPLLCAVAANHIATDTKMETKIEIPQNSPMIAAVRETAIKSLETKPVPAPPPPGTAPATNEVPPTTGPGGGTTASAAVPTGAK